MFRAPSRWCRNKPADLVDGCWTGGAAPTFTVERQFLGGTGTSFCNTEYPGFTFPRFVAGSALANDIVKCRLRPIDTGRLRGDLRAVGDRAPAADLPGRRLRLVPARRRTTAAQGYVAHVSARWSLPQPEPRRGRRRGPRPTRPPRRRLKRGGHEAGIVREAAGCSLRVWPRSLPRRLRARIPTRPGAALRGSAC